MTVAKINRTGGWRPEIRYTFHTKHRVKRKSAKIGIHLPKYHTYLFILAFHRTFQRGHQMEDQLHLIAKL